MSCDTMQRVAAPNHIERVDSGQTDESPFGSNLVTPNDEESFAQGGIESRLESASAILDYFTREEPSGNVNKAISFAPEPKSAAVAPPLVQEMIREGPSTSSGSEYVPMSTQPSESSIMSPAQSQDSMASDSPMLPFSMNEAAASLYNLPNAHISVEDLEDVSLASDKEDAGDTDDNNLDDLDTMADLAFAVEGSTWVKDVVPFMSHPTFPSVVDIVAHVILFLPWCLAVGAAIVLSPDHLDKLAFGLGYLKRPKTGLQKFAHWAEYGLPHVTTFFGALSVILYMNPAFGSFALGGALAQFCYAWSSFMPDSTKALGEDDKQTIYLLATGTWWTGDALDIKKSGDGFFPCNSEDRRKYESVYDDLDHKEL